MSMTTSWRDSERSSILRIAGTRESWSRSRTQSSRVVIGAAAVSVAGWSYWPGAPFQPDSIAASVAATPRRSSASSSSPGSASSRKVWTSPSWPPRYCRTAMSSPSARPAVARSAATATSAVPVPYFFSNAASASPLPPSAFSASIAATSPMSPSGRTKRAGPDPGLCVAQASRHGLGSSHSTALAPFS
jgi:hypothetical protein